METYDWLDQLSCGHTRLVSTVVPINRDVRLGEITICYSCRDEGILGERAMVTITATRLMEQLGQ